MNRVVITGIGAVTPIGLDVPSYFEGLKNGVNGIGKITKFDTEGFKATVAAELKGFEPTNYVSKGEARRLDPFTIYAIAASDEAVKDSDIIGKVDENRFGVYLGSGIGGFDTFTTEQKTLMEKGPNRVSPHFIPKMIPNIAAGNVAIRNHAKGSCLDIATACATSTTCIGEAYRAVKHGYLDAVIAGGSEAAIDPLGVAGFTNCMALTQTDDVNAASIPFDKRRNGFVMGEGAACLVMETYEHAKARGAKIYAEIVGYGTSCDAFHVTAPDAEGEGGARAISDAIKEAKVTDDDVIYLNAHGTSTPLNDKTETLAIKRAFGERASDIHVSSTKSMTGHMLGAAGAVEALACIFALNSGIIPPTINYVEPDPECDLDVTPNTAVKANPTVAFSTSLGFGGHNACIALRNAD